MGRVGSTSIGAEFGLPLLSNFAKSSRKGSRPPPPPNPPLKILVPQRNGIVIGRNAQHPQMSFFHTVLFDYNALMDLIIILPCPTSWLLHIVA
jgi:hypothetical protein